MWSRWPEPGPNQRSSPISCLGEKLKLAEDQGAAGAKRGLSHVSLPLGLDGRARLSQLFASAMSDTTGNTTSPPDPTARRPASAPPTSTLVVAIAQSKVQPGRIGEVARPGPRAGQTLYIGREGAPFGQERVDGRVETGRLHGDKLSREQLEIRPEGDGARIHNVGNALVRVNGAELPRDCSARVDLPAVIEIVEHYVLILMRRPLAFPESHRLLAVCQLLRGDWVDALQIARGVEEGAAGADH